MDSVKKSDVVGLADKSLKEKGENPFPAIELGALLEFEYPPRELLLDPWLPARSLSMIHGPRGVGKTYLTLSIALAVASGGEFLGWKCQRPSRVLYIDGEMTCSELQGRSRKLLGNTTSEVALDFMPRDSYSAWMPYLDSAQLQASIESNIKNDTSLIVVDNLSTLWRGKENEADCWDQMQEWMGRQKQKGISVLLVHHTNKKGDQRGSNRKEDNLDVVVGLRRPESYQQNEGARFVVEFTKCRSLYGANAASFEARLVDRDDGGNSALEWQGGSHQPMDTLAKLSN